MDCHTHVWEYPAHISEQFLRDAGVAWGNKCTSIGVELEQHWKAMEVVDRAVVLGFRAHHVGVLVPNEYVAEYTQKHQKKLVGFCSVDPNDADAVEQLEHSIQNLNLCGLKLGPVYQNIFPSEARFKLLFKRAQDFGIPVLIHQGATFCSNARMEVANPMLLEPVAHEFPQLRIVVAHMGHPWVSETLIMLRTCPNLFADISALCVRPWQFYNSLVAALEYGIYDKLLFGSDYPFTTPLTAIAALREINKMAKGTNLPTVPVARIEELIHRDTFRLLGIA